MLQRVQSILLILTAIALCVFLGTNTWIGGTTDEVIRVNPFQVLQTKGSLASFKKEIFYVAVLAGIAIIITVFTLFQYKNRIRQMLFVGLNSLLIGSALAVTVYHVKYDAMTLSGAGEGKFDIGLYAGFAALLFNWFANRFIKKDEKMVRDADRMR